jgi:hypothetical protein
VGKGRHLPAAVGPHLSTLQGRPEAGSHTAQAATSGAHMGGCPEGARREGRPCPAPRRPARQPGLERSRRCRSTTGQGVRARATASTPATSVGRPHVPSKAEVFTKVVSPNVGANFGEAAMRVVGRPLARPAGLPKNGWLAVGISGLKCTECPSRLGVIHTPIGGHIALLCAGCSEGWSPVRV